MKKNKKIKKLNFIAIVFLLTVVPFFSGCGNAVTPYNVSIEIWGPFDDSSVYATIIDEYKKVNPFVKEIKYRKFSVDTYQSELLDALASGNGPDIYMINNSWLPAFKNKLASAPFVSQAFPTPLVSEQNMKDNFPDTVLNDFSEDGNVYAVPLTVDSLQLYYNKDIFNAAAITAPPKTWNEFDDYVQRTSIINANGDITQSGASIGTVKNINRPTDLLMAMMLQNGVEFPMKKGAVSKISDGVIAKDGNTIMAAENSLKYYTQFSKLTNDSGNPNPYYSWNDRNHYSIDAFTEGTLGMTFNYSWQIKAIKSKNAKLNFGIAPIPQSGFSQPATYANYWGYGVSLNKVARQEVASQNANTPVLQVVPNEVRVFESWQFLRFLTLKNAGTIKIFNAYTKNFKDFAISFDPALDYLVKTDQPAARRDIIESQKTDPLLGAFVTGNLIAKNWRQPDSNKVENIFGEAIMSVNRGNASVHDAMLLASTNISLLIQGQ
jgi:ABC-type glycerol-3-phosphate transport system substrate-binding protein